MYCGLLSNVDEKLLPGWIKRKASNWRRHFPYCSECSDKSSPSSIGFKSEVNLTLLSFIDMFTNKNRLMSSDGYCFTQLQSAIKYCQHLNHDNVGISMVEFNSMIYQKEI